MMSKLKDEGGNRYGRLVVLERVGTKHEEALWKCLCDCGNITEVLGGNLRSGNSSSCGCIRDLIRTKHGLHKTKVYMLWKNIVSRCSNPNNPRFMDYGGRGIVVCKDWRVSREAFMTWALDNGYREGLQIDRIDNNKEYSPHNCRFVSNIKNQYNKRRLMVTNKSGYCGVFYLKKNGRYLVSLKNRDFNRGKTTYIGCYPTKKAALEARNKFIRDNNLPHRIQEYHGE